MNCILRLSGVGALSVAACFGSYVSAQLRGGTSTTTPGQVISDIPITGVNEKAQADYGLLRSYVSSSPSSNRDEYGNAYSGFHVDFNLSAPTTIDVYYHYSALISENASQGPSGAHYKFGIEADSPSSTSLDPGGTAFVYLAMGNTEDAWDGAPHDYCPERTGLQSAGTCSGTHTDTGVLHVKYDHATNNFLAAEFWTGAGTGGVTDGFNTGQITRVVIPDGITFTYSDLSGNPLNVQYASSAAAPEPAALGGFGLLLLGIGTAARRIKRASDS